jgi:3-methyladenine DNA glycosylase/8-oxoguanine DNA glycosylase
MNTQALWEHALDHLTATAANPEALLTQWRHEIPNQFTDDDLLREYAWVVYCCGLTPQVIFKYWARLGEAYWGWAPAQVAAHRTDARIGAIGVLKAPRKVDAILNFADDLAREPGLMARLAPLPTKQALAKLTTLPWVGPNNKYHLARNLGWDTVVKQGPVARLAAYLETTPDELCERIAAETGERARTVDLVLWHWGHQVGDTQMREHTSFFKLL